MIGHAAARLLICFVALLASAAAAQPWAPSRPVRVVIPYGGGGSTDLAIRVVSDKLSEALGQPLVIDIRPGASGIIGTDAVAKSPPDGYTWVGGSDIAFTILPHLQKVPYDPIKDLEPVSLVSNFPLVLVVNAGLPVNSMQDLVALARQRRLNFGSNGIGSSGHLASEQLKAATGIQFTHVPYKGQPQVNTDLVGGQVDFTFSSVGPIKEFVKSGRIRAIGVTSPERIASLPEVPTMKEAGFPDVDVTVWIGLLMPAQTPPAITERVSGELVKILQMPDIRARFASIEHTPAAGTAAALRERIRMDYDKWGKLIRATNMKLD